MSRFPFLLLFFATTVSSWIVSNRIILQHIRTTHVPSLISSGRSTDTTSRYIPFHTARSGSNSDNPDVVDPLLQEVRQEIRAVKYCIDNFGNITVPEGADKAFIQLICRYKKFKVEDDLVGMLRDLQSEKTKLLPRDAATVSKADMGTSELLLASKEETIREAAAKDAAKDGMIRLQHDIIAEKNAALMDLQGRLALRFVVEEFEKKATKAETDAMKIVLKSKGVVTNPSDRQATWEVILRSKMNVIGKHLIGENRALTEEEINRWVKAAQELYQMASKYIHNYSPNEVSINTVWLPEDAVTLAISICETLPVKYTVIKRKESAEE